MTEMGWGGGWSGRAASGEQEGQRGAFGRRGGKRLAWTQLQNADIHQVRDPGLTFSDRNGDGERSAPERPIFSSRVSFCGRNAKRGSYLDVKMSCHCSLCVQFQVGLD